MVGHPRYGGSPRLWQVTPDMAGHPGYRNGLPGKKVTLGRTRGSYKQLQLFDWRRIGKGWRPDPDGGQPGFMQTVPYILRDDGNKNFNLELSNTLSLLKLALTPMSLSTVIVINNVISQ